MKNVLVFEGPAEILLKILQNRHFYLLFIYLLYLAFEVVSTRDALAWCIQ